MAHIFQVGAGSGGIVVLDLLARDPRVDRVTLVEPDSYKTHNVHRHLFPASAVGRAKGELAAEWLRERRPELAVEVLAVDLTAPEHQSAIEQAAAACDVGVCAADNEPAKYHFDQLMRQHGKPWTLGEVLSGGIAGWVHRFTSDGPCYGCVASHLQRSAPGDPAAPAPNYADPHGQVRETTIPAGKASIDAVASLHALVTLDLVEGLAGPPPAVPLNGDVVPKPDDFTSLLFTLARVPGVFDEPYRAYKFRVPRSLACLICSAVPTPPGRTSMRHWIRRYRDWAMSDLLHFGRPRPTEQAVHTRYEKAGLTLYGPPVPWNADAVVVEVLARLPPTARQRGDFTLRLPGRDPTPADAVRPDDTDATRHRVFFRLSVPPETVAAEVLWKHRLLATVPIVVLPADQFLAELRVTNPTAAVRLGGQAVAAQTFVAAQCRGLTAAAVLRSPTGLAPLADLGVTVTFRPDRGGAEVVVPVPLTGTQLAGKEALVTAAPAKAPRRSGVYTVAWAVGGRELHAQRLTAVTGRRFIDSLRVSDARFVSADKAGKVKIGRHPPPAGEAARLGPCFLLASREVGAAGLLTFQVIAVGTGSDQPPLTLEQQVLITDGPTAFAPGMVDVGDLAGLTGFELRHRGRALGVLSVSPVPSATFNAEGSFKPPPDFAWSNTAEDELAERLGKLMGGQG